MLKLDTLRNVYADRNLHCEKYQFEYKVLPAGGRQKPQSALTWNDRSLDDIIGRVRKISNDRMAGLMIGGPDFFFFA